MEKSELDSTQVFDFVGYQFDLTEGKVRPTLDQWQTLKVKIQELLAGLTCLSHMPHTSRDLGQSGENHSDSAGESF